jgi:hypothetical protein
MCVSEQNLAFCIIFFLPLAIVLSAVFHRHKSDLHSLKETKIVSQLTGLQTGSVSLKDESMGNRD